MKVLGILGEIFPDPIEPPGIDFILVTIGGELGQDPIVISYAGTVVQFKMVRQAACYRFMEQPDVFQKAARQCPPVNAPDGLETKSFPEKNQGAIRIRLLHPEIPSPKIT